jgi:hypothetical protein
MLWLVELTREIYILKLAYNVLKKMKLDIWDKVPNFSFEEKCIIIALSRFHDKFVWIDKSHEITREKNRDTIVLYYSRPII